MRRTAPFAAAIAACAALGIAGPAPVQAFVCGNCAEESTQLASWLKQAADMAVQIRQAQARYEMLQSTFRAIAHPTDAWGALGAIGTLGGPGRTSPLSYASTTA